MRNKKILLITLLVFFIILLFFLGILSIKEINNKIVAKRCAKNIENFDSSSPFSINKIVFFSSANGETSIKSNSAFNVSNLHQYTDIAIFINNNTDGTFDSKNTLKKVTLTDINFSLKPTYGTPNLYYKNLNKFASDSYEEKDKIENAIEFATSSEDEIDFSSPVLFNNCANPITLCYVNLDIVNDYTLSGGVSNISYDGSLLKNCNITLNSIACKIYFLVTIINNLDETYLCPVTLSIPLSTENSTIYDGNLILNLNSNYRFIKK